MNVFILLLFRAQPVITPHSPSLSLDRHKKQLIRIEDVNSIRHKDEIVDSKSTNSELANEYTFRIPSIHQVSKRTLLCSHLVG